MTDRITWLWQQRRGRERKMRLASFSACLITTSSYPFMKRLPFSIQSRGFFTTVNGSVEPNKGPLIMNRNSPNSSPPSSAISDFILQKPALKSIFYFVGCPAKINFKIFGPLTFPGFTKRYGPVSVYKSSDKIGLKFFWYFRPVCGKRFSRNKPDTSKEIGYFSGTENYSPVVAFILRSNSVRLFYENRYSFNHFPVFRGNLHAIAEETAITPDYAKQPCEARFPTKKEFFIKRIPESGQSQSSSFSSSKSRHFTHRAAIGDFQVLAWLIKKSRATAGAKIIIMPGIDSLKDFIAVLTCPAVYTSHILHYSLSFQRYQLSLYAIQPQLVFDGKKAFD